MYTSLHISLKHIDNIKYQNYIKNIILNKILKILQKTVFIP